MPVGAILPYVGSLSDIPVGWHLCDGTDGTPDLTDRFLQGTIDAPGNFIEPGLPNLKGYFIRALFDVDGVLFKNTMPIYKAIQDTPKNYITAHNVDFNASNYNPIYRDDINTVQPSSYTVYYIIKIK